jgi:hypothetical protein
MKQMNKIYITSGIRNQNLPPPNWSPTGEEGYWVWRGEKWSWLTDGEYKELKENEKLRTN